MAKKICKVKCTNSELSVKPFRLHLMRNKLNGDPDDEGAWQSDDADLVITWKNPGVNPWAWPTQNVPRGAAGSNFGTPNGPRGVYGYTLQVTRPGKPTITIDPEVEPDDGGPPGGGKKAAKKATKKKGAKKTAKRR